MPGTREVSFIIVSTFVVKSKIVTKLKLSFTRTHFYSFFESQ